MKASERLRELPLALEPWAFVENTSGIESVAIPLTKWRSFQAALPLIADCIEATEELCNGSWPPGRFPKVERTLTALRDALSSEPRVASGEDAVVASRSSSALGSEGSPPPPEGATAP